MLREVIRFGRIEGVAERAVSFCEKGVLTKVSEPICWKKCCFQMSDERAIGCAIFAQSLEGVEKRLVEESADSC